MRKPSLIHRGYLYAQKRVVVQARPLFDKTTTEDGMTASEQRMCHAKTWRAGYLAAQVDARRRAKNR